MEAGTKPIRCDMHTDSTVNGGTQAIGRTCIQMAQQILTHRQSDGTVNGGTKPIRRDMRTDSMENASTNQSDVTCKQMAQ